MTVNVRNKELVSVIISVYNESSILEQNLILFVDYMNKLAARFDWEIILVNDGSSDSSGTIADEFSQKHPEIKVFHHVKNRGLGQGLRTAFDHSKGKYVVTLDVDLSFSLDHIEKMLDKLIKTHAKIIIASPMLPEGKMAGIPWFRHFLSLSANKFLSFIAPGHISTLTSMCRAYDGEFIRSLNLRSMGMEIMPEIIYKTMIMNEKIEEIPGNLIWIKTGKTRRSSKMRIVKHTVSTLFSGFLLRPFLFFILPGLLFLMFSLYVGIWMFIHLINEYSPTAGSTFIEHTSFALEKAYQHHPHTFLTAFFSLLLSIQLISIGLQSLQSKHYFEELYYLITRSNYKKRKDKEF